MAVLLLAGLFLFGITWSAGAASNDTIAVTSTVGAVLSVQDTCSGAFDISVVPNSYLADTCGFTFGASNDSTATLRIDSSAGALLAGGVFGDHAAGCGSLAADTIGAKVSAVGTGVSAVLGCPVSGAATDDDFVAVADTPTNACSGTTAGLASNTCDIAIGLRETGGDAPAGSYAGTLVVDVIG